MGGKGSKDTHADWLDCCLTPNPNAVIEVPSSDIRAKQGPFHTCGDPCWGCDDQSAFQAEILKSPKPNRPAKGSIPKPASSNLNPIVPSYKAVPNLNFQTSQVRDVSRSTSVNSWDDRASSGSISDCRRNLASLWAKDDVLLDGWTLQEQRTVEMVLRHFPGNHPENRQARQVDRFSTRKQ
jgi:hypothetical protein